MLRDEPALAIPRTAKVPPARHTQPDSPHVVPQQPDLHDRLRQSELGRNVIARRTVTWMVRQHARTRHDLEPDRGDQPEEPRSCPWARKRGYGEPARDQEANGSTGAPASRQGSPLRSCGSASKKSRPCSACGSVNATLERAPRPDLPQLRGSKA